MIITDDNFSTIVRAVSHGRALYDNLLKYIRFQMAALVGYLAMFVLAGIFSIAGGIPLAPLPLLWVNFANDVPIAAALGFDKQTPGLMSRRPRALSAPVLTRTQWIRLSISGFVCAICALLAYVVGEDAYDVAVAATMLLVTISLLHIVIALSVRDEYKTIFSRDSMPAGPQLRLYGVTLLLTLLVTEIGFLQRIFATVGLSLNQWLICLTLSLVLLAYEEGAKFILRRRDEESAASAPPVDLRLVDSQADEPQAVSHREPLDDSRASYDTHPVQSHPRNEAAQDRYPPVENHGLIKTCRSPLGSTVTTTAPASFVDIPVDDASRVTQVILRNQAAGGLSKAVVGNLEVLRPAESVILPAPGVRFNPPRPLQEGLRPYGPGKTDFRELGASGDLVAMDLAFDGATDGPAVVSVRARTEGFYGVVRLVNKDGKQVAAHPLPRSEDGAVELRVPSLLDLKSLVFERSGAGPRGELKIETAVILREQPLR